MCFSRVQRALEFSNAKKHEVEVSCNGWCDMWSAPNHGVQMKVQATCISGTDGNQYKPIESAAWYVPIGDES
eukprot:5103287-Amphidinium_carterae.1